MASYKANTSVKPYEINKFLGLNETIGEVEAKIGEFVELENMRITKSYDVSKRPGHYTYIDFGVAQDVQAIWYGNIASKEILLTCWDGDVYEYDMAIDTDTTAIADLITEGTVTIVGTITDVKTSIFWFNSKIYFLNGTDYKEYNGTTYQDVVPYIPTISIGVPPAGGGTLFEEINLLTGAKTSSFVGDGASTLYQLPELALDADLVVITVDGVTKTETTDFTVNRTLGQVTFTVAPITDATVLITWHKDVAGNPALVTGNKYARAYGVSNDTNLFLWGDTANKNTFRFSATLKANYFPVNSFVNVGTDQFSITDLVPMQQQLLVFKKNATKIITPEVNPLFADNPGLNPFNYPYRDLNTGVGNFAPNMVQLIKDSPVSLDGFSMWIWSIGTGIESERTADIISDRIKESLGASDLSTAVTFDYQQQKEYWLNIGNVMYVWNYGNNTFYKYLNFEATEFIDVNGMPYYAGNGTVENVSSSYLADVAAAGTTIPCRAALGFSDLGALQYRKAMSEERVAISPALRTSVDITFVTDQVNEGDAPTNTISYAWMDFDDVDFDNFTFLTNDNPQPSRIKAKVKKFTYLQTIFENNTNNESLTILKILLNAKATGSSR